MINTKLRNIERIVIVSSMPEENDIFRKTKDFFKYIILYIADMGRITAPTNGA